MTHRHDENCRHLLGSLSDYVDGTVDEAICDQIEQHLADCNNCRIVVDTLKRTVYLVQESNKAEFQLPEDVRDRLYKALNLEDFLKAE
jgi:predicted anti-sigma-YlaC factor YlaD